MFTTVTKAEGFSTNANLSTDRKTPKSERQFPGLTFPAYAPYPQMISSIRKKSMDKERRRPNNNTRQGAPMAPQQCFLENHCLFLTLPSICDISQSAHLSI